MRAFVVAQTIGMALLIFAWLPTRADASCKSWRASCAELTKVVGTCPRGFPPYMAKRYPQCALRLRQEKLHACAQAESACKAERRPAAAKPPPRAPGRAPKAAPKPTAACQSWMTTCKKMANIVATCPRHLPARLQQNYPQCSTKAQTDKIHACGQASHHCKATAKEVERQAAASVKQARQEVQAEQKKRAKADRERWAKKLRRYLSDLTRARNKSQITPEEARSLGRYADAGDPDALKHGLDQLYRKGWVCTEHRDRRTGKPLVIRHGCDKHCNLKHQPPDLGAPACRAGCHASNWITKAVQDAGRWFQQAGKDISKGLQKAGTWIKKRAEEFGKGVVDFFKNPAEALCQTLFMPVCPLVKIAIAFFKEVAEKRDVLKAIESLFNKFKNKVEKFGKKTGESFEVLFKSLEDVFSIERKEDILPRIGQFALKVINKIKDVTYEFHKFIEMPDFLGKAVGFVTGASVAGAIVPPVALIATIHFGARKLMEWLVPQLILGLGDVMNYLSKLPAPVREVAKVVFDVVKTLVPAAGGLLGSFLGKDTKERLQAVLRKVADVSGKISRGIKGALAVAEQIRTGQFADVEKAFAQQAKLPKKLTPDDFHKIIGGLVDFARDQIWAKLEGLLGKLLGKLFGLLDPLLDSARATLIGPVGSIPFVGGVLSSVLNVGAGVLVSMGKDFIIRKILEFAHKQLDHTLERMKKVLRQKLLGSSGNLKRTEGFMKLVQFVGNAAGEVSALSADLASGMSDVTASLGALAANALDKFLLNGVRDPDLRALISKAIGSAIGQLGRKGRFDLVGAVTTVLNNIREPLANLVTRPISDPRLQSIVRKGVRAMLESLANAKGVRRVMTNPAGFVTGLGLNLVHAIRAELASFLVGRAGNPQLTRVVSAGIGALMGYIKQRGFSALLRFRQLLGALYRGMKQPLIGLMLRGVRQPEVKAILERALAFVTSELESKPLGQIVSGGVIAFLARLVDTIKTPLVNLLLKDVPSPEIRALAERALDEVLAKAKSGEVDALLRFRNVVQRVEAVKRAAPKSAAPQAQAHAQAQAPSSIQASRPTPGQAISGRAEQATATAETSVGNPSSSPGLDVQTLLPTPGTSGAIQISNLARGPAGIKGVETVLLESLKAKRFNCGRVLETISDFVDPSFSKVLSLAVPAELGKICFNKVREGFWCRIPDALDQLGRLIGELAAAVWEKRQVCKKYSNLVDTVSSPGVLLACGVYHYAKEKLLQFVGGLKRSYRCFSAMWKADRIGLMKVLLQQVAGAVCKVAGNLVFDAILTAVSGGSGAVASGAMLTLKVKNVITRLHPKYLVRKASSRALTRFFAGLPNKKLLELAKVMNWKQDAQIVRRNLAQNAFKTAQAYATNIWRRSQACETSAPAQPEPGAARFPFRSTVISDKVEMKLRPDRSSLKLGRTLRRGDEVEVLGRSGSWFEVKHESLGASTTAYVTTLSVKAPGHLLNRPATGYPFDAQVLLPILAIKARPKREALTIGRRLKLGDLVRVVGRRGPWFQVEHESLGTSRVGFVPSLSIQVPSQLRTASTGPYPFTAKVIRSNVVMKVRPNRASVKVGRTLRPGDTVEVVARSGSWFEVKHRSLGPARTAFVPRRSLQTQALFEAPR